MTFPLKIHREKWEYIWEKFENFCIKIMNMSKNRETPLLPVTVFRAKGRRCLPVWWALLLDRKFKFSKELKPTLIGFLFIVWLYKVMENKCFINHILLLCETFWQYHLQINWEPIQCSYIYSCKTTINQPEPNPKSYSICFELPAFHVNDTIFIAQMISE